MTQIDFYFHVENKMQTACALSAKAYARGLRVLTLCASPEASQHYSRMLWSVPAISFIPHCSASDSLAAVTPVIVDHEGSTPPHDEVLINLCPQMPAFFSRFQRLVEIVSIDEQDRENARARYKFYRDRGYDIKNHDLSKSAQ